MSSTLRLHFIHLYIGINIIYFDPHDNHIVGGYYSHFTDEETSTKKIRNMYRLHSKVRGQNLNLYSAFLTNTLFCSFTKYIWGQNPNLF